MTMDLRMLWYSAAGLEWGDLIETERDRMSILEGITLLAGVALFLFGMTQMGEMQRVRNVGRRVEFPCPLRAGHSSSSNSESL